MNLFFDLDGTLTDPGVGIARCLQHALLGLGHSAPPEESLFRFVGPPLHSAFQELLSDGSPDLIERAIALYRERFVSVGMFENVVYPGVADGLSHLRAVGHRLWIVTSKPHVYARVIVDHFGLALHFEDVYGPELSGLNADKTELIRHVLATEAFEASGRPWMIGDRRHDVEAAHRNGLPAVGVLWGYGTAAELTAAGADALAPSMPALLEWVAAQRADSTPSVEISETQARFRP